ncbi:NAD(P)H-hydrate dehydratase [Candidatus Thorarchaeota archaeon]|nr:MAG: NAD(P)H-hydrate dehydratase [Candidatus Thorarchaeota archaeon]
MENEPISNLDMRILELNTEYLGITLGMLMQQAGREIARAIEEHEDVDASKIAIFCGSGGNGGDGMVAARHLHEAGANVELYVVGTKDRFSSSDTIDNWRILEKIDGINKDTLPTESSIKKCNAFNDADIIIDALLGFGLSSNVREPIRTAIKKINKSVATIYAVDVPSGIDSETGKIWEVAVEADYTVTLHAPKMGLMNAAKNTGNVIVAAIGIPPEAKTNCGKGDLWPFTRPRRKNSHKGDFGRILVIGGSDIYSGAPALSAMAALRSGADLVSILAPEPVVPAIRSYSPNLMVEGTGTSILNSEAVEKALDRVRENDVIALGPGLGRNEETVCAVHDILEEIADVGKPIVIDADGLKAMASSGITLEPTTSILTPHWGELGVLLEAKLGDGRDPEERLRRATEGAVKFNSTILLKGPIDIIVSPDGRYKLNHTGCPAMTVGGTGDVLTGITAVFLARGLGAFRAAAAAAFASGKAGENAFENFGNHITATDCIEALPVVLSR